MTGQPEICIRQMEAGSPLIPVVAGWRHREWFAADGLTREESVQMLSDFIARCFKGPGAFETALVCELDGRPVGTCLLVEHEYGQQHEVSPWLAGLYVEPDVRRKGLGGRLVRAIEDHARRHGFDRIFLYTTNTEDYYRRLGWDLIEEFDWAGDRFCHMSRALEEASEANA